MDNKKEKSKPLENEDLVAKKDFLFSYNGKIFNIKEGDKIDVPKELLQNLKTEKVI